MALAIIPARGGSKGIAEKNLRAVGGRSLLRRSIDVALESAVFDRVVVSSDDDAILDQAAVGGAIVDRRAAALARDDVHASQVVVDYCIRQGTADDEFVAMLLPTAPFRSVQNLVDGMTLQRRHSDSAVIAVVGTGKYLNNLRCIANGRLVPSVESAELNRQRQGQNEIYFVSGSYFSIRWSVLRQSATFHIPESVPLLVSSEEGFDVNSPADLEHACQLAECSGR